MRMKVLVLLVLASLAGATCKHRVLDSREASEISAAGKAQPCPLPIISHAVLPELSSPSGFDDTSNSNRAQQGRYSHRARDIIVRQGKPIWIIGKFTYGYLDADLIGEEVEIYFSKNGELPFQKIGDVKTTKPGEHAPVDGIVDDGGRIFVELSSLGIESLPIGRHRVLLVVTGDNSSTEMFIDVVGPTTQFVVTDIDGTLTEGEYSSATEIYDQPPQSYLGATDVLNTLYKKGYHIFYLTSRAEWFHTRTRTWLANNQFPPGTLRTTPSVIGAKGAAASKFKTNELLLLKDRTGIVPVYAFGNKESDVKAYAASGIAPSQSYYFNLGEDAAAGGISHTDYLKLTKTFQTIPTGCPDN